MADTTGTLLSLDTGGSMLLWGSNVRIGSITCVDTPNYSSAWYSHIRHGTLTSIDTVNTFNSSGIEISDTTRYSSGPTFTQGSLLDTSSGLNLVFRDRTYMGGTLNLDGTYVDGTYFTRLYNPIWLNYSIWHLSPPLATPNLIGYPKRMALNPTVGNYSASMIAMDVPGRYEIRWRYQKDQSSHASEIDIPFTINTWGISPQPDYS